MVRSPMLPLLVGLALALGCADDGDKTTDLGAQDPGVSDVAGTDVPPAGDLVPDRPDATPDASPDALDETSTDTLPADAPDAAVPDSPGETASDTPPVDLPGETPVADAPVDAAPDAPVDAAPDAPVDATPDAPVDATPDAPVDATPDAPVEIAADTPVEASPDTPIEVVSDTPVDGTQEALEDVPVSDTPDIPDVAPGSFPGRSLPFEFTRAPEGAPIAEADVTAFTKKVTGLWKKSDWARWVLRTSTGVDVSTGKDDYLGWHNDIHVEKAGDTVTFSQRGGEHNMWIASSKVLSEAINGYLLTGDWEYAKLTEQYCKGLSAVVKGFVWDENDPAPFLMARAIFPMDQSFTLDQTNWKDDGRKKVVNFHDMYHNEDGWNAHTFAWPHNPTWGAEYITNMRSKDDVRSIVRTSMFLPYVVADAPDEWVRTACQETWDLMKGFNRDIVESGYNIRTKDKDGNAYIIPCDDQDLGSYVCYTEIDPTNECCQRISTDLIVYGEQRTEECGNCIGSIYDAFASAAHFYNIPIIWDYHMAAVGNALVNLQARLAYNLLDGLRQRIDSYMHPTEDEPGHTDSAWNKELAVLLVQTASVGLPLTWLEARHIHQQWTQAVADYENWPNWDLWAPTVPDGPVQARPHGTDGGIDIEAVTMFLEYCNSPFKNPAGVKFVDCDIVKDPAKWGE